MDSDTFPAPRFSDGELARRRALVRQAMDHQGIAALLLYGSPGLDNEVTYLTDYPVTREALLLFPVDPALGDPPLLVEYFNHVPFARRVARGCDPRWGGNDLAATVATTLQALGLAESRLGYAGPLPARHFLALQSALTQASLLDFAPTMRDFRLVKSDEELAVIRYAAALTDRAVEALEASARAGVSEHDLIAAIESAYTPLGGQTSIHYLASTPMDYPTVCVPAQRPSERRLVGGDALLFEISAQCRGYPGQLLRTFTIGADPTPAYQRMIDIAVDVFEAIAAILHAGATASDVLDAAERIHAENYSICDDLLHGLGGGYLPPIIRTRQTGSRTQPFTFAANMTVVIQPNIITPDGLSGVQMGELVRVTPDGIERLHHYPMRATRCG